MMSSRRPDRVLGPGHDTFWEWCGRGELRLPCCGSCQQLQWPVASACERCGGAQFTWQRLSGRGTVVSWCSFERDYYAGTLPLPWDAILVELAEGPLFISNPVGFSWRDCRPGKSVTVQFIDCVDGAGSFRLPAFAAS